MTDKFVALHRHDSFSSFDGLDLPVRAAERAIALGQPALGVTNHGTVAGLIDHYRVCVDRSLKPVLGVELYLTESEVKPEKGEKIRFYHQTVLVESAEGYRNLMRLMTRANELFYYKPRVTLDTLIEHGAGLIVLTGCPSSMVQSFVQTGELDRAEWTLQVMASHLKGRVYVEFQHHEKASEAGEWLARMARKHKLQLVATNDAHYVDPEDRPLHDWVLATKKKGKGEDEPVGYGDGFHMVSRSEMDSLLRGRHPWMTRRQVDEALDSTVEIADRCSVELPRSSRMLPAMWGDESESRERLRRKAVEGLRSLKLHGEQEYVERLKRELQVVEGLGYVDYFHAVSEVTDWARGEGILIGPRGSVCGSLLAYVLGVTMVDPLVHGTLFERFLHEQKRAMPDVDLDIDARHHDRVIEWVLDRYDKHAYKIITYGRTGAGNIPSDLRNGFPELDQDLLRDLRKRLFLMKNEGRVVIATEEDVREWCGSVLEKIEETVPWAARGIAKLYFAVRYVGRHPGGVAFVSGEPTEFFALVRGKDQTRALTSYTYLDLEYLGLLKLDFLGLKAMTAISETLDRVGIGSPRDIPLDDRECYSRFAAGDTAGMFQFETRGGTNILKQIEPENFPELAASTALNRPGVSANIQRYVEGKRRAKEGRTQRRGQPGSIVEEVRAILAPTYGALVYQEQIVRILRAGGLEWQECDTFLKGIKSVVQLYSWSFDTAKSKTILEKFVANLVSRGFDEEKAKAFVERIAQYTFNMSHATAYSLVAYWQMWLRVHYPLEFWRSMLASEHLEEVRWAYEGQAARDGVILLPPDINGTAGYSVEDGAIRVGLSTIKGVGEKAARAVEERRPYSHPRELLEIPKRVLNARVKRILLDNGALEIRRDKVVERARRYNEYRRRQTLQVGRSEARAKGVA